jgi:predicted dehydrogenase
MCIPFLLPGDIRYRWDLAGGALMDTGCYVLNLVRFLAGAEPEVLSAEAKLASPRVDRRMVARLRFPDGPTARITCSLFSASLLRVDASVEGERGRMSVLNPIAPHLFHRLVLRTPRGRQVERVRGETTYAAQLRAFAAALRGGPAMPTSAGDAVLNMRAIDAVYAAAGLPARGA